MSEDELEDLASDLEQKVDDAGEDLERTDWIDLLEILITNLGFRLEAAKEEQKNGED